MTHACNNRTLTIHNGAIYKHMLSIDVEHHNYPFKYICYDFEITLPTSHTGSIYFNPIVVAYSD